MYRGKFAFQNRLGYMQLVVRRKFTIFALFYVVFEDKFQVQALRGGLYSEGRFNGGFCALRFCRAYIWRGLYMEGHIFGIQRYLSTQIIAFAKEAKSKKLLFQELPYHGVNVIFYNQGQVRKSLGSYMYMRVFTVFEQFLCLLTGDFKCHTVPSVPFSFQTLIPA